MQTPGGFLNDWVNHSENEHNTKEVLEYSEREVLKMLEDYKNELSKPVIINSVNAVSSVGFISACPYRVQNDCNFKGTCSDENCNIRAKPKSQ